MGKYDKAAPDQPKFKRKPVLLPTEVSKEQAISNRIIENVFRHQDKIDANKAANLELARQEKQPLKKRKKQKTRLRGTT